MLYFGRSKRSPRFLLLFVVMAVTAVVIHPVTAFVGSSTRRLTDSNTRTTTIIRMPQLQLLTIKADANAFACPKETFSKWPVHRSLTILKNGLKSGLKDSNSNEDTNLHIIKKKSETPRRSSYYLLLSLMFSVIMLFSSSVPSAYAGFGPSSGATTSSPPGLTVPTINNQDLIGGTPANKRLKMLIGSSIDGNRLQEFNQQLDQIIQALNDRQAMTTTTTENTDETAKRNNGDENDAGTNTDSPSSSSSSSTNINNFFSFGSSDDSKDELAKAITIQQQILERERLLERLGAQPYWFNYLAAFIGSLASTMVVHPIDTIKTRLMLRGASEAAVATRSSKTEDELSTDHHVNNERKRRNDKGEDNHDDESNSAEGAEATTEESNRTSPVVFQSKKDLLGLYDGLTGNLLKEAPPSALYLGVYETVKVSLLRQFSDPRYLLFVYLLSGAAG